MPRYEERKWRADLGAFGGRKSRTSFTYRAYVPDPVADLDVTLSSEIAEVIGEADRATVLLNHTPPAVDNLEALARQLLRAESVASSRIEGLVMSHRRLARAAFAPEHARDVTAESILGNIRAMEHAIALGSRAEGLSVEDLSAIHRVLLGSTRDAHLGGAIREVQNWIGGASDGPRDAEFIPPPPELVTGLLDDLCSFLTRDDLPPVVQAAIAHAQFETIHPFADGNGRVGRCLIHVVLIRRGLAARYVPPVSLVLAGNSRAYIAGLGEYRAGRIAEWCGTFAAAARTAAQGAGAFAEKIADLQRRWMGAAGNPRRGSTALQVISALPAHPILDVKTAETIAHTSNQAARLAMIQLEEAGVLKRINVGKRNRAWEAVGLFDLLNAFERDLGSRRRST